mmetsp:Transcript_3655/g.8743  ORF Transcript_3655/g.8743 Transcript_3655/m.8743 type:complete len:273 (+) Transcript_3655:127-945(+)
MPGRTGRGTVAAAEGAGRTDSQCRSWPFRNWTTYEARTGPAVWRTTSTTWTLRARACRRSMRGAKSSPVRSRSAWIASGASGRPTPPAHARGCRKDTGSSRSSRTTAENHAMVRRWRRLRARRTAPSRHRIACCRNGGPGRPATRAVAGASATARESSSPSPATWGGPATAPWWKRKPATIPPARRSRIACSPPGEAGASAPRLAGAGRGTAPAAWTPSGARAGSRARAGWWRSGRVERTPATRTSTAAGASGRSGAPAAAAAGWGRGSGRA